MHQIEGERRVAATEAAPNTGAGICRPSHPRLGALVTVTDATRSTSQLAMARPLHRTRGMATAIHDSDSRVRMFVALAGFILVCQLAGASGALVTDSSFYRDLVRPAWAPPGAVFAPVWITLYTLMGVAAWLVWRTGPSARNALQLFAIQLVLNAAWTPVFFGARSIGGGLVVIVVLEVAILFTIAAFYRRSRLAAALMVPYAAWVAFATALNASLFILNR